ncbi:hypothetical protein [Haloglomus litoreum]|uniref:hypothetical protein n=1 Tax=Haloglomus litoreum TaxID=3034026 RepID=UPI0023E84A1A|nr:hypothetical protein [Haloglomus sp. DT116]
MVGLGGTGGNLGVVVAQSAEAGAYTGLGPAVRAGITFGLTLLLGAMVVNALPNRTARATDIAVAGPVRTVVYGFATLLLTVGTGYALLFVPLVALFAGLGLLLFLVVTSVFGATIVGRFLGGTTTTQCLVIGAAVAAGLAIVPVGGGVAQLVVNAVGAGALFQEVRQTSPDSAIARQQNTADSGP